MDSPAQEQETKAMQYPYNEAQDAVSGSMNHSPNAAPPRFIEEQFEKDIRACTSGAPGERRRRRSLVRQYRAYQVAHYPFAKEVELETAIKAAKAAGNEELSACTPHVFKAKLQLELGELWRTETSSWSYDDTSSDEEGRERFITYRRKSRKADHGRNARDQSDSQCSTNTAITGHDKNPTNAMFAPKEEHGTATPYTQSPAADFTAGDHLKEIEGTGESQSTNGNDGSDAAAIHNKNTANDESASTKGKGEAETDAQSLSGDFATGELLEDSEDDEENQSISGNKSSAAAEMSPTKEIDSFGDVNTADRTGNGPVPGHHGLHASFDIEPLEIDKPTKIKVSTSVELTGDLEDVEIEQNNDCHLDSTATGAGSTVKAESSQVVQAAERSDTAKEGDAAKDPAAADAAAQRAQACSTDAVEGTPDNETSPASEDAPFSKHMAEVMKVDDDHTVQNGKPAVPVNVGWLEKIRNLFYV